MRKHAIKYFIYDLANKIERIPDTDLEKISDGTHEFSIQVVRKKNAKSQKTDMSIDEKKDLLDRLKNCHSREEGDIILSESLRIKKDIESFARFIEVMVQKKDDSTQIKNKIIEATIGAIIRSNAIQGRQS